MSEPAWDLAVAASAERQLARLPSRVAPAIVEFMLGPLTENPQRVGHPLRRELEGLWSARRGAYRIVNEIDDEQRVIVLRIDHRADIYRPANASETSSSWRTALPHTSRRPSNPVGRRDRPTDQGAAGGAALKSSDG